MKIFIVWECYWNEKGEFKKIIKKIYDSFDKVEQVVVVYNHNENQWLECEARTLE